MAVSKRTRFEVLRRDGYACRYCKASDVPLVMDHVLPISLGGSDDAGNVVAACNPCNNGKASTGPDETAIADVDEDAVRWARARNRAVAKKEERRAELAAMRQPFLDQWERWDAKGSNLPPGWRTTVDSWVEAGISVDRIIDAMEITIPKRGIAHDQVFRYMGGIIRNWLRELDDLTEKELSAELAGDVEDAEVR